MLPAAASTTGDFLMIYRYLALLLFAWMISGCGGGQDAAQTAPAQGTASSSGSFDIAPGATYSLTVGRSVSLTVASVSGFIGITYSVEPALPAGLALDPNSGIISGTPNSASPPSSYAVMASSGGDTARTSLMIEVVDRPLLYAGPALLTVGVPMSPLAPSGGGTIKSYTVAPALPSGISLDPVTGVVSGTPVEASGITYHQITAVGLLVGRTYGLTLNISGAAGASATGVFRDSTVTGLGYRSGSHTGVTDSEGHFAYDIGQSISFSVGSIPLGTVAVAKQLITPVDLVANGTVDATYVVNVARFLMMLDQDGDPSNGIQISAALTAAATSWDPIDFTTSDLPTALAADIVTARDADGGSHTLPDAVTAQSQLTAALQCAYSGGFTGSVSAGSPDVDNDLISIAFTPDGHAEARIVTLPTGASQTSSTGDGLTPTLDGTFTATVDAQSNASIHGTFVGPDMLTGTYFDGGNGSSPRAFTALRIGGASDAFFRYSGAYLAAGPYGDYPSGSAVMDMDAAHNFVGIAYGSTDGAVYGDAGPGETEGFLLNINIESQINGSVSGSTVSATLDGYSYTGMLKGTTLQFGVIYDSPFFVTEGCQLN
jgi:Putative Ig domain